jgi:hypothetical protein
MVYYRIRKRSSFWRRMLDGTYYLVGFRVKDGYDYRLSSYRSYWVFFLTFREDQLSLASAIAKDEEGEVVQWR